jgi:translation initiation factor 5B
MGHVDTGKTKLLDKIRRTNVQDGEAGGITQQIGATYFPGETLRKMTSFFTAKFKLDFKLPGILIIDTPGHESFSNLRSRGTSLCDVAVLVVDIMHGIEQQTIEAIELLRAKKSMFLVALNKIDCLVDWRAQKGQPFVETFKAQNRHARDHFQKRLSLVQMQFQEVGLNTKPYYQMKLGIKEKITDFPICPTSAITGEGIPDLLMMAQWLTQTRMVEKLSTKDELQCTVLEVKVEEGIGVTLDVILVNGALHVNDTIVIAGLKGPIVTHIRALLTPEPLKELRVHGNWVHHDVVYAAMGCKVVAPDLEGAFAGSELFVPANGDEIEDCMGRVNEDVGKVFSQVERSGEGVLVQASSLGSLEAFINHVQKEKIPIAHVGIGPVWRKDVMLIAAMGERAPRYACILAFDVPIMPDARVAARENKITVFDAPIIYHLTQKYNQYVAELVAKEKEAARAKVTFPVKVAVLPNAIFRRSKPIIVGVRVLDGTLRKGTPLVLVAEKPICIGTVELIKQNNVDVQSAGTNAEVSIQVSSAKADGAPVAGDDFKPGDFLVSKMSREIIDLLKAHFRDEVKTDDWRLIVEIKRLLGIR